MTVSPGYGLDREAVAVPGLAQLRALWVDDPNGCDDLLAALAAPAVLPELHTVRVSGRCRFAGPLTWRGGGRQVIHPDTPGPSGWQPSVRHGQSPYRWVADAWPD